MIPNVDRYRVAQLQKNLLPPRFRAAPRRGNRPIHGQRPTGDFHVTFVKIVP